MSNLINNILTQQFYQNAGFNSQIYSGNTNGLILPITAIPIYQYSNNRNHISNNNDNGNMNNRVNNCSPSFQEDIKRLKKLLHESNIRLQNENNIVPVKVLPKKDIYPNCLRIKKIQQCKKGYIYGSYKTPYICYEFLDLNFSIEDIGKSDVPTFCYGSERYSIKTRFLGSDRYVEEICLTDKELITYFFEFQGVGHLLNSGSIDLNIFYVNIAKLCSYFV